MAGMQFEYDEEGGTFYYFLLSFWALVLFPATYYLWPRKKSKGDEKKYSRECNCEPCCYKREALKSKEPWLKAREKSVKIVLIIGWVIFILLAYKVSKIQLDYEEYDPFKELGVDKGATLAEIKKAYRRLSLTHHPDRGGDHKKFMRISKAYAALTDEESRKNWEEYGNPDGPGVTRFGIALPKWIVERENSMWVLAVYVVVFMVILPIVVGIWWHRSIRFSGDQVLLDTTRLYWYFLSKTPNMVLKRAVMILSASFEFNRAQNTEIVERPSDNVEIPALIKNLPNLQEKNKEKPLCFPYSVKARALILAHFQRLPLPHNTLEIDKKTILQKCPYLINEMVNICANQVALGMSGKIHQAPRLETIENIMKMSQMVVQALEEKANPLQQLPHITPDMLRHFTTKKRNIRGMRDLAMMKEEDRRPMLRGLNDEAYADLMEVLRRMPHVTLTGDIKVLDDEDSKTITAGSIVTVVVKLVRQNMECLMTEKPQVETLQAAGLQEEEEEEAQEEDKQVTNPSPQHRPHRVWEKQKKKQKKGGAKPKKKQPPKQAPQKAAPSKEVADGKAGGDAPRAVKADDGDDADSEEEKAEGSEGSEEDGRNAEEGQEDSKQGKEEDDEDDWAKFQQESKKENSLETKVKESHPVHCPYFPAEKQECWWLYVADRKRHMLITAPVFVCSLKTEEEIQLKFSAPPKPGHYQYSVVLRSDSYFLDLDKTLTIKLDVKEAKIVKDHPQWDISDEEDKEKDDDETEDDSEYSSEEEDSE